MIQINFILCFVKRRVCHLILPEIRQRASLFSSKSQRGWGVVTKFVPGIIRKSSLTPQVINYEHFFTCEKSNSTDKMHMTFQDTLMGLDHSFCQGACFFSEWQSFPTHQEVIYSIPNNVLKNLENLIDNMYLYIYNYKPSFVTQLRTNTFSQVSTRFSTAVIIMFTHWAQGCWFPVISHSVPLEHSFNQNISEFGGKISVPSQQTILRLGDVLGTLL